MEIWQKVIAWERSNPLRIEDQIQLNKRVMFAFEQCLLCLGHFPNIWHQAASHLQEISRVLSEKGVLISFFQVQNIQTFYTFFFFVCIGR